MNNTVYPDGQSYILLGLSMSRVKGGNNLLKDNEKSQWISNQLIVGGTRNSDTKIDYFDIVDTDSQNHNLNCQ